MAIMKEAIILAGGEGTRMRPLTLETPKVLIPLEGKGQGKSLLEIQIDLLKKYGIKKVYLSLCYMADKIKKYVEERKNFGLTIEYLVEEPAMGTAGPLMMLRNHPYALREDTLMINGDIITNVNLREAFEAHKRNHAIATIVLTPVEDPSAYGAARLDAEKIVEFVEKPQRGTAPSNLINTGYYILSPDIKRYIPQKSFVMMEREVFPILASEGKLFCYIHSGQWFDIGTFDRLKEAEKNWKGI